MIFLMVAAVVSHVKVKDGLRNNGAALAMLVLSVFVMVVAVTDPASDQAGAANLGTQIVGIVCCIIVVAMVIRSKIKGDYNLENYDLLGPPSDSERKRSS